MTRKLLSILSGGLFVLAAGAVSAEPVTSTSEPVKLTLADLDRVTAGAAWAQAYADAFAFGDDNAYTETDADTVAISVNGFNLAFSESDSVSYAD